MLPTAGQTARPNGLIFLSNFFPQGRLVLNKNTNYNTNIFENKTTTQNIIEKYK